MQSYYEILGVSPQAQPTEIRAAYHAAALRHHPDKISCAYKSHASPAAAEFECIKTAYEVGDKDRGHTFNARKKKA